MQEKATGWVKRLSQDEYSMMKSLPSNILIQQLDYESGTYYIQLSYNLLTKGLAIEYLKNVIKEFHHDPLFMLELYEESSI